MIETHPGMPPGSSCEIATGKGGREMKKRTILIVVLLLALALPLAATASAEEIAGTGTITAKGAGLAIIRGTGNVDIEGHGVGIVWVKDAERLEASGEGYRWEVPETGATVFLGWSGSIHASGHDMTIWMAGGLIEFTASGTGKVYLRGRGTYELNGHAGAWNPMGETLRLPAAQPPQ
jgi:hypothetical protein